MMKEAGIKDEDVAAEISARGGPKYHPKTIATRYSRIKRMLQKLKDDNLDDELTDWHEGEVSHGPARSSYASTNIVLTGRDA